MISETKEKADKIKAKGNDKFKNKNYISAIEYYTQAIEVYD